MREPLAPVSSAGLPVTLGETLLLRVDQQWCMWLQQGERASSRMGH